MTISLALGEAATLAAILVMMRSLFMLNRDAIEHTDSSPLVTDQNGRKGETEFSSARREPQQRAKPSQTMQ